MYTCRHDIILDSVINCFHTVQSIIVNVHVCHLTSANTVVKKTIFCIGYAFYQCYVNVQVFYVHVSLGDYNIYTNRVM